MTKFTIFDDTNAPAEAKATLRSVKTKYGFIPNLMGELAASPSALEAYTTLSTIYVTSGLNTFLRMWDNVAIPMKKNHSVHWFQRTKLLLTC